MIQGLLFDYDGVMTKNNDANTPPSEKLETILNLPSTDIGEVFTSFWADYLRGKITDEEVWERIETYTGRSIPQAQRDIWSKWEDLRPLPEMLKLIDSLKRRGFQIGLLTNVTPTTEKEVREGGGYDVFDLQTKSCEAGFAKPDPEIYDIALKKFDLPPKDVVYIDDRERFLLPARALGMHAILSTSSQQVIEETNGLIDRLARK